MVRTNISVLVKQQISNSLNKKNMMTYFALFIFFKLHLFVPILFYSKTIDLKYDHIRIYKTVKTSIIT